jgi:gas vesicle protein
MEARMARNGSGGSFFTGLAIGGVIGAAAALLMAPQSGESTRAEIRERGSEIQEKAEATYARMQVQLQSALSDLRARVDHLSQRLDEALAGGVEALAPMDEEARAAEVSGQSLEG